MLSEALVALDRALTGKEPADTAECRRIHSLDDLFTIPFGGVIHLADGGYSRIAVNWDADPPVVFLCSNPRPPVARAWEKALEQREAVNVCLRRLWEECCDS